MGSNEQIFVRTLESGNFFGEISSLYGCKRSATVKAIDYCVYGELDPKETLAIFEMDPAVKRRFEKHAVDTYDDRTRMFLIHSLRQVDYLEDAPFELISELAYTLKWFQLERGSNIFKTDQICNFMFIVCRGTMELTSLVDGNTDFCIERLGKGSVVNAHTFLINQELFSDAKCASRTTIFTLTTPRFFRIIKKYPNFFEKMSRYIKRNYREKDQKIAVDYHIGN